MQIKLKELMAQKKITDSALARLMGCNKTTVMMWREGGFQPRADTLVKLCEILDCSADDLLSISRKQDARLPRAMATKLFKSVNANGRYNSTKIHQMATAVRQARGNKITEFETWLRNIAEAVYLVELTEKKKAARIEDCRQICLFDKKKD